MRRYSHISVAIPLMDERKSLSKLVKCIRKQTFREFEVFICVNQPEDWWNDPEKRTICLENEMILNQLRMITDFPVFLIDKSSQGNGWDKKRSGVGWARKVILDTIVSLKGPEELIVSLDGDVQFSETYFQSVLDRMNDSPDAMALTVPYYHSLNECESNERALLRYEIYMRYYVLQLFAISNMYAFVALGSAMVFPVWAYNKVGGITPLKGGEDFYLIQKFCKTGMLLLWNSESVFPEGRISERVPFGTGPAVLKGCSEQERSYPFYPTELFQNVAKTYTLFATLYSKEVITPMSSFMEHQLKSKQLWEPLRKNFKKEALFIKACCERVDGLRILQYLKSEYKKLQDFGNTENSTKNLMDYCKKHNITISDNFSFELSSIDMLNDIRDMLYRKEMEERSIRDKESYNKKIG